jgi:hypothetical protein
MHGCTEVTDVGEGVIIAARRDVAVVFDVWGQRGWYGFDVAGESFHSKDIERLFRGEGPRRRRDARHGRPAGS